MTLVGAYNDVYSDTYVAGGSAPATPRYNPNSPIVAGDEWLGARMVAPALGVALGRCALVHSTVTENVATLLPFIDASTAGASSQHVLVGADIYDLANPLVDSQSWALAVPSSNAAGGGQSPGGHGVGQGWQKSTTPDVWTAYDSNAWQNVNDVVAADLPLSLGAGDQLIYSPAAATPSLILFNGGSTLYNGDTGASAPSITGKRIGWVEVICVVENRLPNGCTIDGVITDLGRTRYNSDSGPVAVAAGGGLQRLRFGFYWNPTDHQDWDANAAAGFLNGGRWFGIKAAAQPNASAQEGDGLIVTSIMIQFRVLTERRVATGYGAMPLGKAWRAISMVNPLTGVLTPWSKVAGHDYLIVFHLTNDGGVAALRALDSPNVVDHETDELTDLTSADVTLDDGGAIPTAAQVENPAALTLMFRNAGHISVDSQPYASVETHYVNATNDASQRISSEVAGTYGAASVLVRSLPDGHGGVLEDAPLQVSLRKTSDDSLLAGPASIDETDVPADGKFHLVTVRFPAAAVLTGGEQVYLKLTSASERGWVVQGMLTRDLSMLASDAVSLSGADVGVGGQIDFGLVNGVSDLTLDFPWSIREVPNLLTGLASTVASVPNRPALTDTDYRPATLGFASLSWIPSTLGAQFARYELQRRDYLTQGAATGTWHTIAMITDEASSYFNDWELPRNVEVFYRVRVVGIPLGRSDWASFAAVTVTLDAVDFAFASNWDPDLSLGAQDADTDEPARAYTSLPGTGGLTIVPIYGADLPAAFRKTERGGDVFTRRLLIAANDSAVTDGSVWGDRALFDALVALFHSFELPYVCVADGFGRRWFAVADIASGSTGNGMTSQADVTFTEIAFKPEPITTPTPWLA